MKSEGVLMRLLRGIAGALLWIVASLLGLVAVVLCATLILLPIGLPLLNYARKLFGMATRLLLPRVVAHPVAETRSRLGKKVKAAAPDKKTAKRLAKGSKKARKRARKLSPG
jgi:hypothetical protein